MIWKELKNLLGVLLVSATLIAITPANTYEVKPTNEQQKPTIELPSELKAACGCESSHSSTEEPRQFNDDGTTVRRDNARGGVVWSRDWGACQINDHYWDEEAQLLGLDYKNSREENYEMALYIYEKQGISAWKWSYDPSRNQCKWEK